MAIFSSTIVVPSTKFSSKLLTFNITRQQTLPNFRHFTDTTKRFQKVSSFIPFAVNGNNPTKRNYIKTTPRRDSRNPLLSEGRDEDGDFGPICPGCGIFMQDKNPNLPGYYQQREVKVEIGELGDGFNDDYDDDDGELGFMGSSENKHEEDSKGLKDEFDWDSDELEAMLMREDDDEKLDLDGFTPAGVGYGNVTQEVVERAKNKMVSVSKAEKKRMAREAEKVKEEVTVCVRYHSLRNYGQVKNQTAENLIPDFDFDRLISTRLMNPAGSGSATVVVMVVDCVDFDGSFPRTAVKSLFKALESIPDNSKKGKKLPKLVLVATKVDLLLSQVSPTRLDR